MCILLGHFFIDLAVGPSAECYYLTVACDDLVCRVFRQLHGIWGVWTIWPDLGSAEGNHISVKLGELAFGYLAATII